MKKVEFNVMDYDEFDDLVNANLTLSGEYEFIAYEESSNDVSHTYYNIIPLNPDNEHTAKYTIPEIEGGDLFYKAGDILEYLCWKGVIQPGNYIIEVCW